MIEAHFVQRGARGKGADMPTDTIVFLVATRDHGHRIPANNALDPPFKLAIARIGWLFVGWNRIDVRRVDFERYVDTLAYAPWCPASLTET